MFFTIEKLERRINELEGYRYRDYRQIDSFYYREDDDNITATYPPAEIEKHEILKSGDRWSGRDRYLWLSKEILLPDEWQDRRVLLRINFGRTGQGNTSGFEALLFLNGKPYQGVDTNHQEVFFPKNLIGQTVRLDFRLWSGLEGGGEPSVQEHRLQMAGLSWLDEISDDLYYTSRAVLQTINILDENNYLRQQLVNILNNTYNLIDWSRLGSEEFYNSVYQASSYINKELGQLEKSTELTVNCVGHTHIDVAWLWQLCHTREKAARSFSTVLRLMEMYPEYIFLQSQPQLYEYIKRDYPEIYMSIKDKVAEGRWEPEGSMWLEADCNLTSGESLVRQILYGKQFFHKEFDIDCRILWLPDVFGYSWALPQILKKSGIDTFVTTKISWNQFNQMPHDTFIWRGIDGSEILTHFITTPDTGDNDFYTYNGRISAATIQGIWNNYKDKRINNELLLAYGYGDGGGGVNRDMLEMRKHLDSVPGLPVVKTSRAGDYFDRLHRKINNTEQYIHTWDGELYLEYHRGTYTSQGDIKRWNRKLELLYRDTEIISVINSIQNNELNLYPADEIYQGWKIILRNQFHDIIPGSSIHEVYEDARQEYQKAEDIAVDIIKKSLKELGIGVSDVIIGDVIHEEKDDVIADVKYDVKEDIDDDINDDINETTYQYSIFNSASWQRNELVEIPSESGLESGIWLDYMGQRCHAVKNNGKWIIELPDVPAMAISTIKFLPGEIADMAVDNPDSLVAEEESTYNESSCSQSFITVNDYANNFIKGSKADAFSIDLENRNLESPFYKISWNKAGQLIKLYDKEFERDILAEGQTANQLQVFEDKPLNFDAWDIDIFYQEKMKLVNKLEEVKIKENNGLRLILHFEWSYLDSLIKQDMILYKSKRRIDFQTEVDWQERQQLLKAAFPVEIRATEATYDIQYGNVKRPTHWNTSWDMARFETVGQQWADLSEGAYGVSLLNDCKYGYDIKDNVMRISLIKSAVSPDYKADRRKHYFTYSLYPHQGGWSEGNTVRKAWNLNNPLRVFRGSADDRMLGLFTIEADNIMIDAVKKAEDKDLLLLRVHDYKGKRGKVLISSDKELEYYQECNLMEEEIVDKQFDKKMKFEIKPYEIKTFLIKLKEV